MTERTPIKIVYDGDCPFCSNYVGFVRLRENFDVEMIDARENLDLVRHYHAKGYDLSEGMIVEFPGAIYFGADAMHILSLSAAKNGLWNSAMAFVFGRRRLARTLYPILRTGRSATLWLLRKSPRFELDPKT